MTDKQRRGAPPPHEPKTVDETPTARARAKPKPYTPPTPVVDEEPDTLERRVERHQVEILKIWAWLGEDRRRLTDLESAKATPREGSDRPSETTLSLRPTRARIVLKNWRPTRALVVLVLGVLGFLLAAALALASLFRR